MSELTFVAPVPADRRIMITVPDDIGSEAVQVHVSFAPSTGQPVRSRAEWEAFLDRTAGSIADATFTRPPQSDVPLAPQIEDWGV